MCASDDAASGTGLAHAAWSACRRERVDVRAEAASATAAQRGGVFRSFVCTVRQHGFDPMPARLLVGRRSV